MFLMLLMFLPPVLIPACSSSSPAFLRVCSAHRSNKQGDSRQPCCTPFSIPKQVTSWWANYTHTRELCELMGLLTNPIVVIISQYKYVKSSDVYFKSTFLIFQLYIKKAGSGRIVFEIEIPIWYIRLKDCLFYSLASKTSNTLCSVLSQKEIQFPCNQICWPFGIFYALYFFPSLAHAGVCWELC